ncbi:MAG: hypothetical protein VCE74_19830, partial [Alphaproteobacteria bacterium]
MTSDVQTPHFVVKLHASKNFHRRHEPEPVHITCPRHHHALKGAVILNHGGHGVIYFLSTVVLAMCLTLGEA